MEVSQACQQPARSSPGTGGSTCRAAVSSKRTRVVVSQSKTGCLTCKARRVKCDEQKPLCGRCMRAGRLCGGYAQTPPPLPSSSSSSRTPPSPPPSSSLTLQPALKSGVRADNGTERLSYLATHVLSLDPCGHDNVWGSVFIQLSSQVECVKAATAAFGAAYESCFSDDSSLDLSSSAWRRYGAALARLRSAFASEDVGLESTALASMILACAEILTQNEENALNHFLGAVHMVRELTAQQLNGRPPPAEMASIKDELVKMDVLIGSYGLAQRPQIAQFEGYGDGESEEGGAYGGEPHRAARAAMHCLYRSRQFMESAAQVRYRYPSWRDRDAAMQQAQSRVACQCRVARKGLASLAERLQEEAQSSSGMCRRACEEDLADIYGLRTHVTATLAFILCVHDPFQTLYDQHHDLFQSIITDAAAASRLRKRSKPSAALKRFSTRPGVVSPLFLVTMKCRDPSLRAMATAMLKDQGREGPSDGSIMAAIGARVAALESSPDTATASGSKPPSRRPHTLCASDLPSSRRIHGHGVFPQRKISGGRRVVDVQFCRPDPPLEQGWGTVDYTTPEAWRSWIEPVEI